MKIFNPTIIFCLMLAVGVMWAMDVDHNDYEDSCYDTSSMYMRIWELETWLDDLESKLFDLYDENQRLKHKIRNLENEH